MFSLEDKEKGHLKKSNILINILLPSNNLEAKLAHLGMKSIQRGEYVITKRGIEVTMTSSFLRNAISDHTSYFYAKMASASLRMASRVIGYIDAEDKSWKFISYMPVVEFSRGIFTLVFNIELENILFNPGKNFTLLDTEIILSLKNNYSIPIYEELRSKCFPGSVYEIQKDVYSFTIGLVELYSLLGLYNNKDCDIQLALRGNDLKKAQKVIKTKVKNKDIDNFTRRCLKIPIEEINKCDKNFRAEYKLQGKPAKSVMFTCYTNEKASKKDKPIDAKKELSMNDIIDMCAEIASIIGNPDIKASDCKVFGEAANWDMEIIKEKIALAKENPKIENEAGWILAAINGDYKKSHVTGAKKENTFNSFDQRGDRLNDAQRKRYMTLLEKELLGAQLTEKEKKEYEILMSIGRK